MFEHLEGLTSNDYLWSIGREANEVFQALNLEDAIDVSTAIHLESDVRGLEVPWGVVCTREGLGVACDKLYEIATTPDGMTPFFRADLQPAIGQIREIFSRHDVYGSSAAHASYYLIGLAARVDKPEEFGFLHKHLRIYQDRARNFPQYFDKWLSKLQEQFGEGVVESKDYEGSKLERILTKTKSARNVHEKSGGNGRHPHESTKDYIERAMGSFNMLHGFDMSTIEGLNAAAAMLSQSFIPYRIAAYEARGIPLDL